MPRPTRLLQFLVLLVVLSAFSYGAKPAEPFLRDLPPGLFLVSSAEIQADQTKAIGEKLGGKIKQLTNSVVQVHGKQIGVNGILAADEANAKALHAALLKIKSKDFLLRKGPLLIEFVGRNLTPALATKTSWELGLAEKPKQLRYRLVAELATIERADYMACNPLFNHFLALRAGKQDAAQEIAGLLDGFTFGKSLVLRNPKLESARRQFQPAVIDEQQTPATTTYTFDKLSNRNGVPFAIVTMELSIDDTGLRPTRTAPPKSTSTASARWPSADPEIVALAQQITRGKNTNRAKAIAILEWIGTNLKYSGQTGSRWGVQKVLKQKVGHCWDFSDCFVTLARAAGVPSRQVAGWLYGSSGHVWAEFYREDKGWQQVDPTGAGKLPCGLYHLPWFTTADGEMPILYLSLPKIEILSAQQ